MDQPKLDRLLRIMKMLTANTSYTIEDIADRLETSTRTIYRYIDTFREAGFVLKKNGNIVRIDKTSKYFRDISELVHFTDEEAYILKSAIESIDENNVLKQNLKKKLYSVYDYKMLADTVVKGKNAEIVKTLIEAMEQHKQVKLINYSSAHSANISTRIVEPFSFTTNYIMLWGYELKSKQNKTFKISRIEAVEILDIAWQYESKHKEAFMDVFRNSGDCKLPIVLKMSIRAANLLCEEYPLAEKDLTVDDEGKYVLHTEVASYEGVGRFVLGLFDEIEIIKSPDFKKYLNQKIAKCHF